jgi:hypothetical protein
MKLICKQSRETIAIFEGPTAKYDVNQYMDEDFKEYIEEEKKLGNEIEFNFEEYKKEFFEVEDE